MKRKKSEFLKSFGKMWEIVKLLVNAVLNLGGGDEDLERLLKEPARIKKLAELIVEKPAVVLNPILTAWQSFYHDYLGLDVDLSGVVIPAHQAGFDRVIVIPQGLTMNQIVAACRKYFAVYTYHDDLDSDVPTNERDSKTGAYAICVRDRVEADEENKNLSAPSLPTLTLLERLVYELKYYSETNSHLDIKNITRCSGSRDSDGNAPFIDWDVDGLRVSWFDPGYADDYLRTRSAVC